MKKTKKPALIIILVTVLVAIIVGTYQKNKSEQDKLVLKNQKTIETWGIFSREAKAIGSYGTFYYFFNKEGKRIEFKVKKYYNKLSIGDTVWIRYSVKNNEVAEIVDPYYMQKYQ